ncbi:hypothetical protein R5R35_002164 [Gryllus longicercus]|uniref:Uncharacterized protein n=1 Tax=Gryllus longicercus TaxID=2509291 RepID=A0AAN9VG66_9ORTH
MPLLKLGMQLLVREEDMETGEPCLDHETGEEVAVTALQPCPHRHPPQPPPPSQPTDAETGEPEGQPTAKKKPFQIPKSILTKEIGDIKFDQSFVGAPKAPVSKMSHINCLQHKMACSANMSPILFMLPTVFLFPAWASVLLIVFELICHAYVHKKNKLLPRTSKLVYRSPLHLITSVFCAYCQSDKLMIKIGKMQDERLLRAHRKELAYCSYVERVSVVS